MKAYKIKDLQSNTWFTLKPIVEPKQSQVWVRDEYDRKEKKYWCFKWENINEGRYFKGDKEVYIF